MSRSSTLPEYDSKKCEILNNTKHIRRILRPDGTRAMGAMTLKGLEMLTHKYSRDPMLNNWNVYSLPDGTVYLMEEEINKGLIKK